MTVPSRGRLDAAEQAVVDWVIAHSRTPAEATAGALLVAEFGKAHRADVRVPASRKPPTNDDLRLLDNEIAYGRSVGASKVMVSLATIEKLRASGTPPNPDVARATGDFGPLLEQAHQDLQRAASAPAASDDPLEGKSADVLAAEFLAGPREPTRELDALIAEKWMGFRRVQVPKDYDGANAGETLVPPGFVVGTYTWSPKGAYALHAFAPHYSMDIVAAWEVVNRHGAWTVRRWADTGRYTASVNTATSSGEATATTAPLAICLAALGAARSPAGASAESDPSAVSCGSPVTPADADADRSGASG